MSSHYNTEPPPTASATLHTTVGPIHLSLFARQTPLACKNFLQHCLDGYYTNTTFHRVVPSFIVQAGDPTGSGSGGSSIYEDPEFERDYSRDKENGEKVVFGDEIHSRLRFNRRGLVGMAKAEDGGGYGSQFFVTLAPAERELTGSCTMFGRVEGDGIYNIVKIAEGELVEGTDRPVYAVRITGCEVDELGPFKGVLSKRERIATKSEEVKPVEKKKKKKSKAKGGKALLSFGADEEEEDAELPIVSKPKFNTKLVAGEDVPVKSQPEEKKKKDEDRQSSVRSIPTRPSRKRSRSPEQSPPIKRKPPRDPNTQIPVPDPETPSRSPSPSSSSSSPSPDSPDKSASLSRTNAEIASLKASMRRNGPSATAEPPRKKSALESLIPETSIRGRRRPAASSGDKSANGLNPSQDTESLRMFNAFKARLENADAGGAAASETKTRSAAMSTGDGEAKEEEEEEEEEQLCDLHFIANCQSCRVWDNPAEESAEAAAAGAGAGDDTATMDWMSHRLTFAKDTLGKDLNWKREHEDADGLMVIDPRQKEKEIMGGRKRERERKRKMESEGGREWDQRGKK